MALKKKKNYYSYTTGITFFYYYTTGRDFKVSLRRYYGYAGKTNTEVMNCGEGVEILFINLCTIKKKFIQKHFIF